MEISGTSLSGAASSAPAQADPRNLDKDDFLLLLVAQMENQAPLDPMEGADFVAQLATFSSVEQLTSINQGLETLALAQAGVLNGQAVGLVGKQVVFPGNSFTVGESGNAHIRYELTDPAQSIEIVAKDENGRLVEITPDLPRGSGEHDIRWQTDLPPGTYTFEINATHQSGAAINTTTFGSGRVSGVRFENGVPELIVGSGRVQSASIVEVIEE